MSEGIVYHAPSTGRLRVMRDGHNIIRKEKIPKPVVWVDTREKDPFALCQNHPNWIKAERRATLKTGDDSVEGMENLLALERKSLADLVACTVSYRQGFLAACQRLARFTWKAILVEATLEDIKGGHRALRDPYRCSSKRCLRHPGGHRSQVWHSRHLGFQISGAFDRTGRQLAFQAFYLLVAGTARARPCVDRRGWTLR